MTSSPLRIRLLGDLDLRLGEAALPPLESARAESLLAYLLLHRDAPQPRQHLAFLLWPDSSEAQARTNLRHVLHTLRRALLDPDRYVTVTPRTLQWRGDAPCWLDVAAFEDALARASGNDGNEGLGALREAVALYQGDLLPGNYDAWLDEERARLRQRFVEALTRLTALLEARHDYAEAIAAAERLLRYDPLHEKTYQLLMRLHDARGNRARALRVYHDCVATLERELGVEPSPRTRQAYEALVPADGVDGDPGSDARGPAASPLVGRAPEWAHLTELWRAAEHGAPRFVLVTGEPGVGKTRIIEELRAWCIQRGAAVAEARSYLAEGALAYGPVVAWLRSDALKGSIARLDEARRGWLSLLLPELQEATARAPEPPTGSDPRAQLFDAISLVVRMTGRPLLLIADDLHWADRETLQLLHYLLRTEPEARLLVAATARREEVDSRHPLNELVAGLYALERAVEIPVARLTPDETALLAGHITGRPFGQNDASELYRETEGNPLFVVEALRAGWTIHSARQRGLSPRVQAVIESRLAQLSGTARELASVASTIGREFTPDLLSLVTTVADETLVRALDELWQRRIIREQGANAYDFSHEKIREVAYQALSPARRQHHHGAVARALERLHAPDPAAVGGEIAAQWERAGQSDRAIAWYERAAEAAQKRYASIDAATFLERALDLLRARPDTPERATRELALLAALPATLWVEGYGSDRLARVHERALAIADARGAELAPPLLRSLAIASLTRSEFADARRFGTRLQAMGERDGDDVLVVESAYVLGIAAFWQGQFAAARGHFESAVERYRPEYHRAHLLQYGLDPKVICLSRLGNTLWFLGHDEEAARARDAALALGEEIGHPYSQETALVFAAMLAVEMREMERVRACHAALVDLFTTFRTRQSQIAAEAIAGYIDAADGQAAGLARMARALDNARGVEHAPGSRAYIMRLLIEGCAIAAEPGMGRALADEALAASRAMLWEAETRRLRAGFLAATGAPWPAVVAEFERAIAVARRQGAHPLALRAAISLFHFSERRGDASRALQARDALRSLLAALPMGGDSPERREAQELLA